MTISTMIRHQTPDASDPGLRGALRLSMLGFAKSRLGKLEKAWHICTDTILFKIT